jgi:hypothetical protein
MEIDMPRTSFLTAAALLMLAAPALAGVSVPELPRLDFGDPQETCFPPATCERQK